LLHHAVLHLADVCGDVVVVIAPDAVPPALPRGARVRLACDATEGGGPLAGVFAGLRAVTTTFAIVAGGDMPDMQQAVLLQMLDAARSTSADAVALAEDGLLRPLPCVVRVERATEVASALLGSKRRGVRDLLDELDVTTIDASTWSALDPERQTLFDVDEPGDLST
jgi:molybdopterin-guanine dinucleotide biosynthesis protein A